MPSILVPCEVRYDYGPDGRPVVVAIEALAPIHVQEPRFDGDDFVAMDGDVEVERWPRSRHWCVFPGTCPHCTGTIAAAAPVQLRRDMPTTTELKADCAQCGTVWIAAIRSTLPL